MRARTIFRATFYCLLLYLGNLFVSLGFSFFEKVTISQLNYVFVASFPLLVYLFIMIMIEPVIKNKFGDKYIFGLLQIIIFSIVLFLLNTSLRKAQLLFPDCEHIKSFLLIEAIIVFVFYIVTALYNFETDQKKAGK